MRVGAPAVRQTCFGVLVGAGILGLSMPTAAPQSPGGAPVPAAAPAVVMPDPEPAAIGLAVAVLVLRLLAVHFGWRAPTARRRQA